jgi:hypothetical protein
VTGTITQAKRGKSKATRFAVKAVRATAKANKAGTLTLKIPAGALSGLRAARKQSLALSLTATNANGTGRNAATVRSLRL